MKKSSLVVLSLAIAGAASARDLYSSEDHPGTPLELGIATPVQIPPANWSVYGLRLNLIYGESYDVYGLDLGLVGYNRDKMVGLQMMAAADWVESDMDGVQFAGIANVVCGNAAGIQFGGIVNYTRGDFAGVQFAAINFDGTFYGFQAGMFNYDKGISWGLQLGLANAAVNEFHGWSIAAVNYAERMHGLHLGLINLAAESGRGVQIGVFNGASRYNGIQIGLLNVIGNGELPIMPVLNARF